MPHRLAGLLSKRANRRELPGWLAKLDLFEAALKISFAGVSRQTGCIGTATDGAVAFAPRFLAGNYAARSSDEPEAPTRPRHDSARLPRTSTQLVGIEPQKLRNDEHTVLAHQYVIEP
jgi:hypothetical protein